MPVRVFEADVPNRRRRRRDGERSRGAILGEATRLATVEGIEGLSIGRLAAAVGMSKRGVYAHFGSKEELQLATVEAAESLFARQVTEPAVDAPTAAGRPSSAGSEPRSTAGRPSRSPAPAVAAPRFTWSRPMPTRLEPMAPNPLDPTRGPLALRQGFRQGTATTFGSRDTR
jgi:AcrR family transcriptional regulator